MSFTRAEVSEMRLAAVAAIAVAVGTSAQAAQRPDGRVTVYFRDNPSVPDPVSSIARALASDMFAGIGVRIDWLSGQPAASSATAGAIAIELVTETPGPFLPGALAYAKPYEGVHIRVFYDRIKYKPAPAELLAHVMVHEITHVLQGISRHSDSGIMKANWGGDDFQRMRYKPLSFTEEDVVLTHRGLEARK
jgi:hypothetical protein